MNGRGRRAYGVGWGVASFLQISGLRILGPWILGPRLMVHSGLGASKIPTPRDSRWARQGGSRRAANRDLGLESCLLGIDFWFNYLSILQPWARHYTSLSL